MKTHESFVLPINPTLRMTGVAVIEVVRSNPNGDPDNQGYPRQRDDGRGVISVGRVKRMQRAYLSENGEPVFNVAANLTARQLDALPLEPRKTTKKEDDSRKAERSRKLLEMYLDARLFGALFTQGSTGVNTRGPMQYEDAVSLDPVTVDVQGITTIGWREKTDGNSEEPDEDGEGPAVSKRGNMGTKATVRYGIYLMPFYYDPRRGNAVKVTERDLELFWDSLILGWESDRAAGRTHVNLRRLDVWAYPDDRLMVPSWRIAERVRYTRKIDVDPYEVQSYSDYNLEVEKAEGEMYFSWEPGVTAIAQAAN